MTPVSDLKADSAVLGLDIGGSKTRGLMVRPGRPGQRVLAASANIASVGSDRAGAALDDIVAQLGDVTIETVCAGAAGVNSSESRDQLETLLADRFPTAQVEVVNDTHLILAAAGIEAGAVVIAGTGSAGWARRADGHEARAGGWGYLLGDEGSGYAVARDAVRGALAQTDHGAPGSPLTTRLLVECGVADTWQLLDHFYERPERRYWAERATLVLDLAGRDDPDALRIVGRAACALVDLVTTVTTRLGTPDATVVLAGGLLVHQPIMAAAVRLLLTERGSADVRVLDRDPVEGAADLAVRASRPLVTPREGTP